MKKSELTEKLAEETGLSTAKAAEVLNALIDIVTKAVTKNEDVQITGFATFSQGKRAARNGRNPATGEAIKIPAAKTVKVSVGKGFKDAVNKTARKR
ncbi:HU family DNA-binding protein [Robbsia sp. KACC 23696]|uniref:HU family DNA-binding protein n=1 Tax=Robbsia sp. KACC 23696 TaxID=3149231 RepID=UPI00325C2000